MDNLSPNLKILKTDLSWKKVFKFWKKNEKNKSGYKDTFKKRGFKNWKEWRARYAEYLDLDEYKWNLYEIEDPASVIPYFYGGPFSSWIKKFYKGRKTMKFENIAKNEELREDEKIQYILNRNKGKSTLIGIVHKNRVVIIEGLHRCSAVALMKIIGQPVNLKLKIALTKYDKKLPAFKKFRKRKNR